MKTLILTFLVLSSSNSTSAFADSSLLNIIGTGLQDKKLNYVTDTLQKEYGLLVREISIAQGAKTLGEYVIMDLTNDTGEEKCRIGVEILGSNAYIKEYSCPKIKRAQNTATSEEETEN